MRMYSSSPVQTATAVLSASTSGKRKASRKDSFVLHFTSSSEASHGPSDSDIEPSSSITQPPSGLPIIVNGALVPPTKKHYKCTHSGCDRAYSKPSRLKEHERSHTGQRPFVCVKCNKSYLRETHLHAHTRSHLPESERPLVCPEDRCGKRFWTPQHLHVHVDLHRGAKPFPCRESFCNEAFAKHHQLRSHMCSAHAPPGTKPYQCDYGGCTKSFATNQHLRTHSKVHNEKRYTCVHPSCLAHSVDAPTYFPTWTALQHHLRTMHPPTCSHSSCKGRTFSSQKGLRAHLKLHEEHEVEAKLDVAAARSDREDDNDEDRPRKRRRGGEIGRDWKCMAEGCEKDFKSKKALTTHTNVSHLGLRNHVCPHEKCGLAFGYKHLLQRHLLKVHASSTSDSAPGSSNDSSSEADPVEPADDETPRKSKAILTMDIDMITGNAYAMHAQKKVQDAKALRCPYPHLEKITFVPPQGADTNSELGARLLCGPDCDYVFSRAYDLKRHMRSVHKIETEKESVDHWAEVLKRRRP